MPGCCVSTSALVASKLDALDEPQGSSDDGDHENVGDYEDAREEAAVDET